MNDVSIYECMSIARGIEPEAFKKLRCGNSNWKYYRTMVLFLFGTFNGIHNEDELFRRTKFGRKLIKSSCENLMSNGIWKDGKAYVEFDGENDWMEIILCTMAAMGELGRVKVSVYPVPALPLQAIPALQILEQRLLNQTLDEIRVNKMVRENKPYEFGKFAE